MGCICCKKNQLILDDVSHPEQKNGIKSAPLTNVSQDSIVTADSNDNTNINVNIDTGKMPYEIALKDFLNPAIDDTDLFDKNWYHENEKNKIKYSKRTIVAMLDAAFADQDYQELYNKNNLIIAINSKGSFLTKEFQVVRSDFKYSKTNFPPNTTLKMIAKYMFYTGPRNEYDEQLKLFKVVEGDESSKCILHNWQKSPIFFISERDSVDKKCEFVQDGAYYLYESSINFENYPKDEDVIRIMDYIFLVKIWQDNENIYVRNINQIDIKTMVPQFLINTTLPMKLLSFYDVCTAAMKKKYEEGTLVFEDF